MRSTLRRLQQDQTIRPDAETSIAKLRHLFSAQGKRLVPVVNDDKVVSRAVHFAEFNSHAQVTDTKAVHPEQGPGERISKEPPENHRMAPKPRFSARQIRIRLEILLKIANPAVWSQFPDTREPPSPSRSRGIRIGQTSQTQRDLLSWTNPKRSR